MTTSRSASQLAVGDVIKDAYGNPAVVINPTTILMCAGSDRGRVAGIPAVVIPVTGPNIEWARNIAREEWRKRVAARKGK